MGKLDRQVSRPKFGGHVQHRAAVNRAFQVPRCLKQWQRLREESQTFRTVPPAASDALAGKAPSLRVRVADLLRDLLRFAVILKSVLILPTVVERPAQFYPLLHLTPPVLEFFGQGQ